MDLENSARDNYSKDLNRKSSVSIPFLNLQDMYIADLTISYEKV